MEKWRFLDTGGNTGAFNMALDETILNLLLQGLSVPTLRVYEWKPACLSLGRKQNLDDVNLEKCRGLEIDVVRRPTGGNAVLHKTELTYSAILPNQSYEAVCQGLKAAYKIMGLELGGGFRKIDSANCYSSMGLTDLTYNGKKIAGSVKLEKGGIILQHGSLVIKHHPKILSLILKSEPMENATSLSEIIGELDIVRFKDAILKGFQQVFNVEFFEGKLTETEIQEVEGLLEKYRNLDWRK